jgi:transposase, IS30 family
MNLEKITGTLIYYEHPYTSCDKATVDRHNGSDQKVLPKGKRINDFFGLQISATKIRCNCLPKSLLEYSIPDEIFDERIDRIYQTVA